MNVIGKIKKLLALSESPYPKEAKSALVKAKKLLAEHNLSMEDVAAGGEDDEVLEKNEVVSPYPRNVPNWLLYMAQTIAENFGCVYFVGEWCKVTMLGKPTASKAAKEALLFSMKAAEHFYANFASRHKLLFGVRPQKEHYMIGFVSGIKQRFAEETRDLVVRVPDEAAEYMKKNTVVMKEVLHGPSSKSAMMAAYRGARDGKSARPNQLEGG
jgi:hypothetical protein